MFLFELFHQYCVVFYLEQYLIMSKWENNEEIQIFREYLRIPSVHPNISYGNLFFTLFLLKKFKNMLDLCFQNHVWNFLNDKRKA